MSRASLGLALLAALLAAPSAAQPTATPSPAPTVTADITRTPETLLIDTLDCLWPSAEISIEKLPFEGTDLTVKVRVKNANGVRVVADTIEYAVHDQATGTELLAPVMVSPTGELITFVLPGAVQTIVRSGSCSVATGTACESTADCPTGQTCRQLADEAHLLTLEFLLPGGGRGTAQAQFRVRNLPHYPLS